MREAVNGRERKIGERKKENNRGDVENLLQVSLIFLVKSTHSPWPEV